MSTDEAARPSTPDGEVVAARRSSDPAAIEAEITRRREQLAATVDEIVERAHPKALARRGAADLTGRLRAAFYTPEGDLRVERVGAVAGAVAVVLLVGVLLGRRRR